MTDEIRQGLENDTDEAMKPVAEAFLEYGGIPNYAQQVTVFGQLTEGFEVLDAITSAAVAENDEAHHPKDEIKILTVEITKF